MDVDGAHGNTYWAAAAPATGTLPCSSHASVAHTATRPSSHGPASALRFNYTPPASQLGSQLPVTSNQ